MKRFLILIIFLACKGKEEKPPQIDYAIAGTINTIQGYSDTLGLTLIRIKSLTDNMYVQDAIVKVNDIQISYNSSALGYPAIISYKKNKNFQVGIRFSNNDVNLNCTANDLDSIKVLLNKDSVLKGENIEVKWRYFGSSSGKNMILLKKQGDLEFSWGSGYISINDTIFVLNTSQLDTFKYDLLFISGNFCTIQNFKPYPNFPSSLIFVGRGVNKIIRIK
ncbi:MAG: hypothetical protein N2504_05955 [candidate division WOR-3 bacterium]|nr:hypothetical protein [candidate division WOR-3 bacterium]MCX7948114.1 hypothetical protein [candidate division WOR-3 bacterium]MDW8150808.1 hypothetical protein [candidate division WOR-3 bacterium]